MADVSFTPTFAHTDWVDDVDRVRAAEPNGFNARFTAIETDLQQLSAVVAEVDAVLNDAATRRRITLPPALAPTEGSTPWLIGSDSRAFVNPGSAASGLLNAVLPDGVTLQTFRVTGRAIGVPAPVSISLSRVPIGGGEPQVLTSMTGGTDPFDRETIIAPAAAKVAAANFRYVIQASAPTIPATGFLSIAAFQITFTVA